MPERRNNPTEPSSVREPVSAVVDNTTPPSLSRRRLLKGAASTVPVVVSLASGAAVAQSSLARRIQQITTVPTEAHTPTNPLTCVPNNLPSCAVGYVDKNANGCVDNQDTVWTFMKEADGGLCVEMVKDGTDNIIVSQQNYVNPPIETTLIENLGTGDGNIVITASSWASLDPSTGGYCSTDKGAPSSGTW